MAVFHGGNLAGAAQLFGEPVQGWVDLSTGINPDGYPIPELQSDLFGRLPDHALLEDLKKAASFYYAVEDTDLIVPVSGTQTLLQIMPHLFEKPKKVRVVGPTYKEHEYCWRLAGHDVCEVEDIFDALEQGEIVIVVNPNNPTGDVYAPEFLANAAGDLHAKGGCLIVDGAFVDCTPTLDMAPYIGKAGLVVLRSFGKFFGLAGIRLGFVFGESDFIDRLKEGIGPWAVNGPAMEIARRALRDVNWIKHTRQNLIRNSQRLDKILEEGGLEIVGGTSLFRYCYHPQAQAIYQALGRKGILVRPFAEQENYLRIGLPTHEPDWERLQAALKSYNL